MSETDALVYAYALDGSGGGIPIGWSETANQGPIRGPIWMHLDSRDPQARSRLEGIDLSPLTCDALLEQETRPRSLLCEDGLVLILRGVNCNPGEDPEDMVAIRMLFSEHRIVTMRFRRVMVIQDIERDIAGGRGPASAGEFMVSVAERIADRLAAVVSNLDDQADELEDCVLTAQSHELRSQLAEIRRKAISLRRYIAPQREVLNRLVHERLPWIEETDRARLRETAERTARFVEDIDASRERAAITHEELNSRLSEQMNKAMYTLSIVAAIFLPLGLLTGLLGINVGGIPGTENKWAFLLVTLFILTLAGVLLYWFKKIKWL